MHGGDADEFIDYMNDGEASVRHRSFVYRFSGLKYHAGRHQYRISIEKYRFTKEPFEDFMELVYHYESEDAEDVLITSPKTSSGMERPSTNWRKL